MKKSKGKYYANFQKQNTYINLNKYWKIYKLVSGLWGWRLVSMRLKEDKKESEIFDSTHVPKIIFLNHVNSLPIHN